MAIRNLNACGGIAKQLSTWPPQTAFEQGLRGFSGLLVKVTVILAVIIFLLNALLHHVWLESLLSALAIAIGLTPQLLPAIVTISLSMGALVLPIPILTDVLALLRVICWDRANLKDRSGGSNRLRSRSMHSAIRESLLARRKQQLRNKLVGAVGALAMTSTHVLPPARSTASTPRAKLRSSMALFYKAVEKQIAGKPTRKNPLDDRNGADNLADWFLAHEKNPKQEPQDPPRGPAQA
jgi:hypothetical protein